MNKKLVCLGMVLILMFTTVLIAKKGRRNQNQIEAAIDMTVVRRFVAGCDAIVTTNHFTLAPGESSDPITLDLSTCDDMLWLSFFGYLTTQNSSRTFKDGSNMLVTATNEETGTTATSFRPLEGIVGGRVMIGDVDWVIISGVLIQEPVPNVCVSDPIRGCKSASFFVTNQNTQEVLIRLSSVVHFE